jgi:hypothetical protein
MMNTYEPAAKRMLRVGLTGGIGSGKTTVAQLIHAAGIPVIDADLIAREVVEPGQPALDELAAEFGSDILYDDGSLNRAELAQRAFASPAATARLNAITHPRIKQRTEELFAELQQQGHDIVVWDMPLLVDKGYDKQMDAVIVVDVDADTRIKRLVSYRRLSADDAARRIAAQVGDEKRRQAATYIVDNHGPIEKLAPQVDDIIAQLRAVE